MKQKIFTLIILLALIVVGGKAFGQNKFAPYVNTTHDYSVDVPVANNGDSFYFTTTLATDDVDWTDEGYATTNEDNAGKVTAGVASVEVVWGATAGTYNLWLTVTDDYTAPGPGGGTGCSNHRFVEITVAANIFDLELFAIAVSGSPDIAGWSNDEDLADLSVCHEFGGAVFNVDGGNDDDGNTYVFFRVDRVAGNGTNTWDFTAETNVGTISYSADGTTWGAAPNDLESTVGEYLIRITVDNTAAEQVVTVEETGLELSYLPEIAAGEANEKTVTLISMPALDGVTFE